MSELSCEWLEGLLNGDYDFTVYSRKNALAELASLRTELSLSQNANIVAYQRLAEQARRLDEAQKIIERGATVYTGSRNSNSAFNALCRDWLAANAPAPQEQTK